MKSNTSQSYVRLIWLDFVLHCV